jgi:hypothetical protein
MHRVVGSDVLNVLFSCVLLKVKPDGPVMLSSLRTEHLGVDCSVLMGANIANEVCLNSTLLVEVLVPVVNKVVVFSFFGGFLSHRLPYTLFL